MQIPLLSFFTGGGLLDIGFELGGFDIVWTNEVKPAFADMYEAGISSWRTHLGSRKKGITRVSSRASITDLKADQVIRDAFASQKPSLFGIIGGPPCPDFSVSGRNEGASGDRGKLTQVFVDLISSIRPSFFVMENVPGLLKQKKHKPYLHQIIQQLSAGDDGYDIDYRILNALEYGVPQDRDRLFLMGFKRSMFPALSSVLTSIHREISFPWPQPIFPGAKSLSWPSTSPFGSDVARPTGIPVALTIYPLLQGNVEELPNGTDQFIARSDKFWRIDEGDVSRKSFKRLHRYRYSPTAWYGNNEVHLHPWKPRRLSVREALRIQTVPDEYILPPEFSLTDKFKMITNGVPCQLAGHIACSIKSFLGQHMQERFQDALYNAT